MNFLLSLMIQFKIFFIGLFYFLLLTSPNELSSLVPGNYVILQRDLWCSWSSNLYLHLPALSLEVVRPPWLILSSTFSADLPKLPYCLVKSSFSQKHKSYSFDLAFVYIHARRPRHVMFLFKCVCVFFFPFLFVKYWRASCTVLYISLWLSKLPSTIPSSTAFYLLIRYP